MAPIPSAKSSPATTAPSSNWAALKKVLSNGTNGKGKKRKRESDASDLGDKGFRSQKMRKVVGYEREETDAALDGSDDHDVDENEKPEPPAIVVPDVTPAATPLIEEMRKLVLGQLGSKSQTPEQGKYIALDCEMVGVGLHGGEQSSLARISVVNFHGAVLLDQYVRQVERVVDYRTQWSGIRPGNLSQALPFQEVQQKVSDLMKDRIVVGHALSNDMKALLLSHPRIHTRDTQTYSALRKAAKTKRPGLKKLVQLELGLEIQQAEHDSVTDARAAMALFRLHKDEWDRSLPASHHLLSRDMKAKKQLLKPDTTPDPAGGRKGVSSGLSVITHVRDRRRSSLDGGVKERKDRRSQPKEDGWWKTLPSVGLNGGGRERGAVKKGSMSLSLKSR